MSNALINMKKEEIDIIELEHTIKTLHNYYDMDKFEIAFRLNILSDDVKNILEKDKDKYIYEIDKFIVKYDTEMQKDLETFNTKYNKCLTVE
jgi:hypothetical protein